MKYILLHCVLGLALTSHAPAQNPKPAGETSSPQECPIRIALKTGETLRGDLVKIDSLTVEFRVKGLLQTVKTEAVEAISFNGTERETASSEKPASPVISSSTLPKILSKEKASYTREAREKRVEGVVRLRVIFLDNGKLGEIEVIQGLPCGLNEKAIEAARKIKFEPATKNGTPVSVRGTLEYTFELYK